MTKSTKLISTLILLLCVGCLTACGDDSSTAQTLDGNSSTVPAESKSLFVKIEEGRFVESEAKISSRSSVYVIDEDHNNVDTLYKQIKVEEPVEGLWVPAVSLDCPQKGQVDMSCGFIEP